MTVSSVRPITAQKVRNVLLRGVRVTIPGRHAEAVFSARRPLRIKYGLDPTRPELHLGYLAILRKLRFLQMHGHTIVILIGDFTARFGDPTEKAGARELRTRKEVEETARGYRAQIGKILELKKTEFRYNSSWYDRMSAEDLLRLMSTVTVQQMLERDMFREREAKKIPIGLHEPIYPILQGYDSVMLQNDVTIVGQDQIFNEIVGRHLQEKRGERPQTIFGVDLLVGVDGKQKMSQSLGNHIALSENAEEQFGKIMAVPDTAITQYAELLTEASVKDIAEAVAKGGRAARNAKTRIAQEIVAQIHGEKSAVEAAEAFDARFRRRELPSRMRIVEVPARINVLELLLLVGAVSSRSQAQRLVLQRGIRIDGEAIESPHRQIIVSSRGIVLAIGKRILMKVVPARKN